MTRPISFGYRTFNMQTPWVSFRVSARTCLYSAGFLLVAIVAAVCALLIGEVPFGLTDLGSALTGQSSEFTRILLLEWRLPIALAALVFGALLGLSGGIFQSFTRNPLGSPDVIGFDAGAYTAVVVSVLLLGHGDYWSVAGAALIGGLGAALVVYLLAYRRGVSGFRLIVVGIGVSALLGSVNAYLITRADVADAMMVGFWGAGSLSRITWSTLQISLVLALCVCLCAVFIAPGLQRLELGDVTAITHGARVGLLRLVILAVGVTATALVTAATGPISFIAFAAPQIARRITKSAGVSLLAAAGMGAMMLSLAHLCALVIGQMFRPIPVGIITLSLGGVYLMWVLIREARAQHLGRQQ